VLQLRGEKNKERAILNEITAITPQVKDKTRCNIYIDGRFCCGLTLETVVKNRLKVGKIVSEQALAEMQLESEKNTALNKALGFLSATRKTEREVRAYLTKRGYLPEVGDYVVEKLREYGIGFKSKEPVVEVGIEVGGCSDGYFAQLMELTILNLHHIEPTLEELGKRLTEEREYWEDLYDHVIKIKYTPESSTAEGFVENL
jgi:hypothetical protein